MLALCSDSVVFSLYVPQQVLPFGSVTYGKAALAARLQAMIDEFEALSFEGSVMGVDGDKVRGLVSYRFRHRLTGQVTEGVMRQVLRIRNDQIVQIETFKDVDGVRAFMNYVAQANQL